MRKLYDAEGTISPRRIEALDAPAISPAAIEAITGVAPDAQRVWRRRAGFTSRRSEAGGVSRGFTPIDAAKFIVGRLMADVGSPPAVTAQYTDEAAFYLLRLAFLTSGAIEAYGPEKTIRNAEIELSTDEEAVDVLVLLVAEQPMSESEKPSEFYEYSGMGQPRFMFAGRDEEWAFCSSAAAVFETPRRLTRIIDLAGAAKDLVQGVPGPLITIRFAEAGHPGMRFRRLYFEDRCDLTTTTERPSDDHQ